MSALCLSLVVPEADPEVRAGEPVRKCFWEGLEGEYKEQERGSGEDASIDGISAHVLWRRG